MVDIKWQVVSQQDFIAKPGQPIRVTNVDGAMTYELGTLPQELPTKRGAIIVPSKEWLDEHDLSINDNWDAVNYGRDTFFVLSGDGHWYSVEQEDGVEEGNVTVQEVLDAGGTVVFEGIED